MNYLGLLLTIFGACCLLTIHASILTDKELQILKDAPMIPIKITDEPRSPGTFGESSIEAFKKKCKCNALTCSCCMDLKVTFFTVEGCMNARILPVEKAFEMFISVSGNKVVHHKISANKMQKVCAKVTKIKDAEVCIRTTLEEDKPNELISCMAIDVSYMDIPLININLECLKYGNKQLTFVPNDITKDEEALADLKIKNPINVLIKLIKALLNKLESL